MKRNLRISDFSPCADPEGKYIGTVEVVQDVDDIQKLQGERRLLDWQE